MRNKITLITIFHTFFLKLNTQLTTNEMKNKNIKKENRKFFHTHKKSTDNFSNVILNRTKIKTLKTRHETKLIDERGDVLD